MSQISGTKRRASGARLVRSAFNRSQRFAAMLALVSMLWYSVMPAGAGTNYWQLSGAGAPDSVWDNLNNWSLGTIPVAGDDAIFVTPIPATGGVITLATGDLANSLTFRDAYTLSGGDLTLGAAGNITVASGSTATINSLLIGSGGLTLSASNGLAGADAQTGGGTLVLTGANTYSGPTSINSGILSISASNQLGDATQVTNTLSINAGTLQWTGAVAGDLGVNRTLNVGSNGATINTSGAGTLTISGVTSGAGTLTKIGSGGLILSGAGSYGGGTVLNAGDLTVNNNTALGTGGLVMTLTGASSRLLINGGRTIGNGITINANNPLAGNGTITANGGGLATINGTILVNNTATAGGTFRGGATAADALVLTGAVNAAGGVTVNQRDGFVVYGGGGNFTNFSLTNTAILGASNGLPTSTIMDVGVSAAGTFDLFGFNQTLAGLLRSSGNAATVQNTGATLSTLTINGSGTNVYAGTITGAALMAVVKDGSGTETFSSANTFGGGMTIANGTMLVGNATALGTGNLSLGNGSTLASSSGTAFTLAHATTVTGNFTLGQAATGTGALTLSNTVDLGAGARTITVNNPTDSLIGVVSNGSIVKAGTGTLVLGNAANTFSGLTVNGGLIQFAGVDASLGAVTTVNLNGGGISSTLSGQYDPPATRIFNIGAGGGTFNVTVAGSTGKILIADANQITGAGPISKTGPGDLQISVANNATGNWNISAGFVEFQNAGALGSGTVTASSTGELVVSGATLGGTNSVLISGGLLSSNNQAAASIVNSNVSVTAASTIAARQFQSTGNFGNLTINGALSGSGNLAITGPTGGTNGTVSLFGNNSGYSGAVTVNALAAIQYNNTASVINNTTLAGGRANYYAASTPATPNLGVAGVNATYFNFGSNPNATTNPNNYAVDRLYIEQRAFSRIDSQVNLPNPGANGEYPVIAVPGYGIAAAGGINDGLMWKGLLNISTGGNYQFSGTDDDNLILYIDGQSIGTLGVVSANTNIGSAVALTAGYHSILVKQSQGTGGGYGTVSYNGPDTGSATTLIPQSALNTGSFATSVLPPTVITSGTGTLDVLYDSSTPSLTMASGTGLSVLSLSISNLTVSGNTTLAGGTNTFSPTTGSVVFNGITETAPSAVTMAGPYLATFNAPNSYTGLTTVTGGELDLNATGGNSIPAGLTINAANASGAIRNVRLLQSNQIADTATVTMTQGILEMGTFNDTIGTLVMNGGLINTTGGSVLTVTNLGTSTMNTGTILAGLAGSGGLNKTTANLLTLAGNGSYTGVTSITAGAPLRLLSGTDILGAGGAGNETNIAAGGQLQFNGNANLTSENMTIAGTGIGSTGAIRNFSGSNTIGGSIVNIADGTTIQSDSGRLTFNNAVTGGTLGTVLIQGSGDVMFGGGFSTTPIAITKTGTGTVLFGNNNSAFPIADANWAGGVGFSGAQSFGAYQIPGGRSLRFDSDPGAGVTLDASNANTAIVVGNTGGAGDAALINGVLSRTTAGSTAPLVLVANTSANIDFSVGGSSMGLGAQGLVSYSGTITPSGGKYNFGASVATAGNTPNILALTRPLTGANSVNVASGILNLTQATSDSGTAGLFNGGLTIKGGVVRAINDPDLGAAAGVVTLNGGTLQISNTDAQTIGNQFGYLGSGINGSGRTINVGGNGGTIDVTARSTGNAAWAITQTNSLTGAAGSTLNKAGYGDLFVLNVLDGVSSYKGNLNIVANGGRVNVLTGGAVRGLSGVTLNTASTFQVDNNASNGAGREFVFNGRLGTVAGFTTEGDKIGDTIPFTIQGGTLLFQGRNQTFNIGTGNFERVGTVTAGVGQDTIQVNAAGGGGADLVINNLVRNYGGGTVRAAVNGQTGNNGRLIPVQINGVAPTSNSFVGGWLVVNTGDFGAFLASPATLTAPSAGATGGIANYGSTGFPAYAALSTATAPNTGGFVSGAIGNAAANVVLGTAADGQMFSVGALRMNLAAAQTITFAGITTTPDTLFVESGGILSDGAAQTRTFGATTSNFTRGQLTAGSATLGQLATPQELFFHNNSNTMTINSIIIDNPINAAATVAVVKDLDGQVNLTAANTYTGGTSVYRGTLEGTVVASLGKGPVTVKNSRLNIDVAGTIDATAANGGFNLIDNAEVLLNNTTGVFASNWDRFNVPAGGIIIGPNASNANQGLNSLTRVSSLTAGGQIVLAPNAIVGHQNFPNGDNTAGINTIKNLGTSADLYFGLSNTNSNALSSLTVGAGTPWKGISTDRNARTWQNGAIIANSDFFLQGLNRDGGAVNLQLGGDSAANGFTIFNNAGKPINAYVQGQLVLSRDFPVALPSDLTFVITPGAILQANRAYSMGIGTTAKILVQSGGIIDPGGTVAVGTAANQDTPTLQNLPYPSVTQLNGSVTVEAGGRFILNDTPGVGSAPVGAYLLKTDSILQLTQTTSFSGRGNQPFGGPVDTTGLANPGQFVYEPGAVVRLQNDVYGLQQFVTDAINGQQAAIEIYDGNRNLTNQTNPFLKTILGTSTFAPSNIRLSAGGMITNDTVDRQVNEGRGRIFLGDGAVLAGTSATYLNMQESFDIDAGANVFIGSTKYVDGLPKLGSVNIGINGANSNTAGAGAKLTVIDGAQVAFGSANVIPDGLDIVLSGAVTNFAPTTVGSSQSQPGNGSTILLNTGNFAEVMGKLTGNGAVIGNAGGAAIAVGYGASDFTTNVLFKSTNGQNPDLYKVGTNKMTLLGVSDSTGHLNVAQGTLEISGTGNSKFGTLNGTGIRAMKGATLVIDNTAVATSNRMNNPLFFVPSGGTFNLIGNATTPVSEAIQTMANSVGSPASMPNLTTAYTYFNITPGAAATNVTVTNLERFDNAGIGGQKGGTWVLRSPAMGNQPVSYNTAGVLTINPANATSGLFQPTNPNFYSNGSFGIQTAAITGQAGTSVAPARGDYLGTTDPNGQGDGFLTVDSTTAGLRLLTASEYSSTILSNTNTNVNAKLSGTVNTSGDTRIQTLTLTPGTTVNINGAIPLNTTPSRLLVNDMGIFVQAGAASTINGGVNNFLQVNGGTAMFLHTQGDLNLNAMVFSDTSVNKTNAGTLNLGAGAMSVIRGSFQIDAGTANFDATNNSFAHNNNGSTGFNSASSLFINGGTLNLNGNSQLVNQLTNSNPLFAQGGTITSPTAAVVTVQGGGQFSGNLAGAVALDKVNNNTLTLTNASTNTGSTQIRAGTLELRDQGALSATSNVDLYYGSTLTFNNSYLGNVVDRINPAAPLNVRGGSIQMTGAPGQVSSQTFNTVNLLAGRLDYNANSGGSGSIALNVGNLVRPLHTGSTFTVNQNFGFTGAIGNNSDAIRVFIGNTTLNGNATTSLALNDGIIGGWAIMNGNIAGSSQFMTYNNAVGIGAYSNTGDGFANYESGDLSAATATQNVNDGTGRTIIASKTVNSLRQTGAITTTLTGNVGLTLDTGGYLTDTNNAVNISGFYGASVTSNSGELDAWVTQNTTTLNVPITGNIDLVKSGANTLTLNPTIVPTLSSTTNITAGTEKNVTVPSTVGIAPGMAVTGTGIAAGTTVASITNGTTLVLSANATAAGTNTLTFGTGGAVSNTYTGTTFVNSGTLNLSLPGANGGTLVSVPNNLVIQGSGTATETAANQLKTNASITVLGGGRFNAMNAGGITETFGSLNFGDAAGAPASSFLDMLDRTGSQPTSIVLLSSPTAISGSNTNPNIAPFIGAFTGVVGFTNAAGSTINVSAPTTANGLTAVGLRIDAQIGQVPTGVPLGGLIKSGTGMLVLNPTNNTVMAATGSTTSASNTITVPSSTGLVIGQTITGTGIPNGSYITSISGNTITLNNNATATATGTIAFTANILNSFGNPAVLTDVLNVSQGIVRAEQAGALGSNFANATVQSGAGILGAVSNNQPILGSIKLNAGSFLGATNGISPVFGAGTLTSANQSILNVAGNSTFYAQDYFVPGTNSQNLIINSKLTGSGGINIVGPYVTSANGVVQLGNPISSGTGSNDYNGIITVNPNATLRNQQVLIAPATSVTGSSLGSATINLNGGTLSLRDDLGSANLSVSNSSISYGNNVTLSSTSLLDANRANGGGTGNTINLGTLTIPSGSPALITPFTGSTFNSANNSYAIGFASIDGAGTLIKGGHQLVNINGYAPTFSGNFVVNGPAGFNVQPSAGLNFNAATNSIANLTVNGVHSLGANATTISGTLAVGDNAGTVVNGFNGITTGNTSGALSVPNNATVTAGILANNGIIGSTGGLATINVTGQVQGNGFYQTNGQPLTLTGPANTPVAFNDGASATLLKIAGNNTVSVNPASNGTLTGGVVVQSGTLRIAPSAATVNPFGTNNIRVLGYANQTVATNGVPITVSAPVLNFDSGANSITHGGSISNSGIVRVSSGMTNIAGTIAGAPTTFVPGLLEGRVGGGFDNSAARAVNNGGFGIKLEPRMAQTSLVTQNPITGWSDNDMWVYTGQFYDADGKFTFAENVDDNTGIWIDGVLRLSNGSFNQVTSTSMTVGQTGSTANQAGANAGTPIAAGTAYPANPNLPAGWHTIEIRVQNGGGGAGPVIGNGFAQNFGLGLNTDGTSTLDGTQFIRPIDPGDGSLFRTPVGNKGSIEVLAGATLNAGGFSLISSINLTGGGIFKITTAGVNDADNLVVTGPGAATLDKVAGVTLNLANVNINSGAELIVTGDPTSITNLGTASLTLNGNLTVNGDPVISNSAGTGNGVVTLNTGGVLQTNLLADGGIASGIGAGSTAANLVFNGGTLLYNGPGASTNRLFTLGVSGGTIDSSGAAPLNFTGVGAIANLGSQVGTRTLILTGSNAGPNTFAPILSDNNTAGGDLTGLSVTGAGSWILTGDNTFTGNTIISAPSVQLGNGGTTGSIAGNITVNTNLVLNHSNAFTLPGVISGPGSVTQSGAGTAILTGDNTYTGGTTIAGGTLQLGNGGTTGSIVGNVTDNGNLTYNHSDDITVGVVISGSGSLTQAGTGKVILTGANTYAGQTIISSGILQVGNGGTTGNLGTGDVIDNASLVFNHSDDITVANNISGTGSLTQAGAGNLILGGNNSYTGGTLISTGTLQVGTIATPGSLSGPVTNNSVLNVINGTANIALTNNGTTNVSGGTLAGSVTNNLLLNLTAGSITANVTNNATFTMSGGSLGGNFANNSSMTATGGSIDGAVVNNGQIHINGPVTLTGSITDPLGGPVTGTGSLAITSTGSYVGSGIMAISPITNAGTITARYGNLVLSTSSLTSTGNLSNAPGSSLFVQSPTFVNGGNITANVAGGVFVDAAVNIPVGKSLNLAGGAVSAASLSNDGTINGFGQISTNVTNNAAATFNGPTQIVGSLTNTSTGTVSVRNSQLLVTGAGINAGTIQAISGGTAVFDAGLSGNPPIPAPTPGQPMGAPLVTLLGHVQLDPGGAMVTNFVRQNSVALSGNVGDPTSYAKLLIRKKVDGGDTSVVNSLNVQTDGAGNPLGHIDLTDNALIVDYSAASPITSVRSLIIAGRAGGSWTGNGLTSSSAAAAPLTTAIGYAEASEVLSPTGGTFKGQQADGTSLLVRYTVAGDADLDGSVGFGDLVKLGQNYGTTVSATTESWWAHGDFNYDGVVDFQDLVTLAQNYGTALPSAPLPGVSASFDDAMAQVTGTVPEPSAIGLLAIGALALLRRRR